MSENTIFITQEKKELLEQELHDRKTVQRPDILSKLESARAMGDLKENAEYQTMRDEQGRNESRIREIEHILRYASIITKQDNGTVQLGSVVTLLRQGETVQRVYTLVSKEEADITQGKVSINSPLGEALHQKKEGDTFTLATPKGDAVYCIKAIQ